MAHECQLSMASPCPVDGNALLAGFCRWRLLRQVLFLPLVTLLLLSCSYDVQDWPFLNIDTEGPELPIDGLWYVYSHEPLGHFRLRIQYGYIYLPNGDKAGPYGFGRARFPNNAIIARDLVAASPDTFECQWAIGVGGDVDSQSGFKIPLTLHSFAPASMRLMSDGSLVVQVHSPRGLLGLPGGGEKVLRRVSQDEVAKKQSGSVEGLPEAQPGVKVFVWNFSHAAGDNDDNSLAEAFTEAFEDALLRERCVPILERRNLADLLGLRDSEREIIHIEGIPRTSLRELTARSASGVIFGSVTDDIASGEISVRVQMEDFNSSILASHTARLGRGKRFDAGSRETLARELAGGICRSLNSAKGAG